MRCRRFGGHGRVDQDLGSKPVSRADGPRTTITFVGSVLEELLDAVGAALQDHVEDVAERLTGWSAQELLAADVLTRVHWVVHSTPSPNKIASAFTPRRTAIVWIVSMGRDGRLRERAVTAMADDPSPVADRLLAVRLDDPVFEVRLRAWNAIIRRCSPEQVARIVPVLVALRTRLRSSEALPAYAEVYLAATGQPLWQQARLIDDRDARRWATVEAMASGTVGIAELHDWLRDEHDQWIAAKLIAQIAESGDADDHHRLLRTKRPRARAAGLAALGKAAEHGELERGLLDRAGQVRVIAQWVATQQNVDATEFYLQQWSRTGELSALAGAFETGARFTSDEIWQLCCHQDSRVRNLSLRRLGPDLADGEVQLLLDLLDDSGSASTATRVLARCDGFTYDQVAERWADADSVKRGRLWRLMASRGGWDRVRADLLAMTATESDVAGQGLKDLYAWWQHSAANMYRGPSDAQRADVVRDLAKVELPRHLREAIEMRVLSKRQP